MNSPTTAPGRSAGRTPPAGHHPHARSNPSPPSGRSGIGPGLVAEVGRPPISVVPDRAVSPPLPTRTPHAHWVRGVAWAVVIIDGSAPPVRVVVGFTSPSAASGWAARRPELRFWVLPADYEPGRDWAVVDLDREHRPTRVLARFTDQGDARVFARESRLPAFAVAPVTTAYPPASSSL